MKRLAIVGGLVVAVLAVAVYRAKLGAEETQGKIDGLKADTAKVEQQINVLKAEEAYLTRPERIGPLAANMGLQPAKPEQYVAAQALSRRLGEERLTLPPEATPASPEPAKVEPAKPAAKPAPAPAKPAAKTTATPAATAAAKPAEAKPQ